jgi:aspartyl protease family protein
MMPRSLVPTVAAVLVFPLACLATDVRVVGVSPGRSADVVIDGDGPVTMDVGETIDGVQLLRADRTGAVLNVNGTPRALPLVTSVGETVARGDVTLSADRGGHFLTSGTVNGRAVRFIVDTGATYTTLSRGDARRIGIDYRRGTPTRSATVNGSVNGWRVSLASVSIGGTTVRDVQAVVVDNDTLPIGLLGMSFLDRFDLHRQGSTLLLRRRR